VTGLTGSEGVTSSVLSVEAEVVASLVDEDKFPLVVVEAVESSDLSVAGVDSVLDPEDEVPLDAVLVEPSSALFVEESVEELEVAESPVVLLSSLEAIDPEVTTESEPAAAAGDF